MRNLVFAGMDVVKGLVRLLAMVIDAWGHSQNLKKTSEVITRLKWLVTFIIDLNPL